MGLFIRLQVFESPVFAAALKRKPPAGLPFFEVLRKHPRNIVLAMGARFAENGCFYIFTVFVLTYATTELGVGAYDGAKRRAGGLGRAVFCDSDSSACCPTASGGGRCTWPARRRWPCLPFRFSGWSTPTAALWITVAIVIGLIGHAAMYAPQAAFFSELFGTEVRFTGASIGYQLASPLAGGLAPLIATALLDRNDGQPGGVAIYMIVLAAITLVSVWLAAETHRSELSDHDG